ncbi:MAG: Glycosyl transferase family 2 [Candidatus Magasanikbacteria bacterium GW2011_GWC2_40_17]|uniref:Glycosyl transferase family 2 n=1 Tax=Candidatus Magasanikbacteria bacterium GW2011_GWA2_42_32 TaxID=1619039 RepID=A0A0G1A8A8_9BACT|nr:MAG: Glycosyl transferase family 2 [Candidatus Magasanikbacteria bacterium GW2011_GWC2_40_17]KKS57149.1 MAG: Glycosyl transferase family 2 [Candidatus Magasanikbacteria bacterium GW2011_GWA2_42_32]OGH85330.1 MAG: hypothetical protein A2294_00990 [Candidatus Magasanikbacteria bacterium RIFOXYB2_FULL_38_10]
MSLINITIPVFNEEIILESSLKKLSDFCAKSLKDDWFMVVVNNNSTDATALICKRISQNNTRIKCLNLPQKGKGLAIQEGWQSFSADYYIFMDADLATDLEALPKMIEELKKGAPAIIGSRRLPLSQVERSVLRDLVSLTYLKIANLMLNLKLSDLACGFKGVNNEIKEKILPKIKDRAWFWDTEMLFWAKRAGFKIKEIPVIWTETPDQKRKSKVGILKVGFKNFLSLFKIRYL